MAFLVEIGLNNPSSGASTYDVYITDFDTNTGWIQVVTGITYNQFPVIVNTDDYPDVNDSIKYKIVSDNGCECEGCPGEQITVQYAHEDINGQLTNFDGSNTTYSEMVTIICNYGPGQALAGNTNYKIQKHGSDIAIGDAVFYSWNGACNPYGNRIFYVKESFNIDPGYYVTTDGNGIITQLDYIDCTAPTATPTPTLTETPNPTEVPTNCDVVYTIASGETSYTQSTTTGAGDNYNIQLYGMLHFEESVGNIVNGDILWLSNEAMADPSFTTLNGDVVTHIEVTAVDSGQNRIIFYAYDFDFTGGNQSDSTQYPSAGIGFCTQSATAPTPTPSPSETPVATPNPTASPTPSSTPNATPNPTASPTPSETPDATPPTPNPTASPTPSETPDATPIPTPNPTASPTPSETPDATPNPTASPTPTPTEVSIQGCLEFDYTSNLLEYGYVVSGATGYESLYVQVPSQTGPTTNNTTYERWPSVYPNALPDGIICDVVFNVNGVEYSAVYDYEGGGTGGSIPHGVFHTNGTTLSSQYVFQISRTDQNGDDFYNIFTDFDPSSDSVKITVRGDCIPDPTSTPTPTVTPTPTEAPDVDVSGMTRYLYDIDGYTPVGSEEYFVIRHLNLDGNYRDLIIGYDANNTGGNFSFASYEDPVVLTGGTITFTKSQWSLDEKFGSWQGSDYGYFGPTREIAVSNAWNQFTSCNLGSGTRTYNTLHNNPSSLVDGWIMQRVTKDVIAQFPDLIKPVGREGDNMVWAQFRGGAIAKTTGTPDYGNTNMGTTVFEQGTGQITQKLNLVPWLRLTSQNSSVDEGTQVTITLECYGLSGTYPNGVDFPYTITGIDSSDLSSGSITGIINAVHPNPYANETEGNITFTIATDSVIENETLRLTLDDYNEGSDEGHSIYIDIDINDVVLPTPTGTPNATPEPTPTPSPTPNPAYFVSNSGTDSLSSNGDIDNPFRTLHYAIARINNEDTIYFREGSYDLNDYEITTNGLSLKSYNNENVVFDGTKSIDELKDIFVNGGNWVTYTTDVVTDNNQTINNKTLYRIKLRNDVEIWQLFHDRKEVINARFPSAQWDDESVYSHDNWGHGYYDYKGNGDIEDGSGNIIGNGTGSHYYYENGEIVDVAHNNINLYDFVTTQQGIDNTFDLSGSLINLNVGSFRSYTKVVNSQTLDSSNQVIRLSYDNVATWKEKHHYYYLENKLEFLNSENEWFFDNNTKYLYVWLENDEVPSLTSIRAKVQSYSLNVTADNVTVEDINFFGTTLRGNSADNLTVRDCDFLYASCYPHMLNQINYGTPISPTTNEVFENQTRVTSSSNVTFEGCAFRYTDGDVIHTSGGNTTIEDCYFNYIDKTVTNLSSVMTTLRLMGSGNTVKNNTFRKTAASSTLNSGNAPIIEYNDMAESGYLQSDGAMIHLMTAQQENAKIRFNWVHDTIKYGIRFDGNGEGFNGYVHHNIGWNCEGAIMIKGGELDANGNSVGGHFVYNNTAFNSTVKNDIMVLNVQAGQDINFGSVVMNNLSETLSGHRSDPEAFESRIINSNNFTPTNVEDYLVSVNSNDYRPINDGSIVNAGNTTYTNSEFSPTGVDSLTDDIGAMDYNGNSWQAGITWNNERFNFL